jgi:peptidoglycan/LPS O-acetylase OafA/YrhL
VVKPAFAATGNESWAQVDVWPYLVYLRNWLPGRGTGEPLLDHLWSLAVEEQFYLFWPALVYVVPRRRLAPVCVVLAVGALALRCALAAHGFEMEDAHRLTPARLDTLLLGALLALAIRSERWLAWCRTWMPRVGWAAVVALLILARGTNGFDAFEPLTYTAGWSLTALLSGAIVFAAATPGGGLLRRMFGWRWLRSFGRYSYAIYLLHPLITQLVSFHWLRYLKDQPAAVYWLGVLAFPPAVALGGWAMAWVSWHVLERPFLRLKDHFAYAPPVT